MKNLGFWRHKRIGDDFLVTTDHGSWTFLNEKEFELLKNGKIRKDSKLHELLEKKSIILTEDNKNKIVELMRKRLGFLFQGVSLHIIVLTLRCNQKCVYCHASSKKLGDKRYDMDRQTAKKVVDFIFQSPSDKITIEFQGGEPLLNFDVLKYIVKYARELNKKHKKDLLIDLVTNLSFIDNEKIDFLIKNNVGVCTSLDGPEKLHNKNRGQNYHKVINGIRRFQYEYEKRKLRKHINALITITRESLKYPKEIVDEYLGLGMNTIHLRFLNNLGDARPVWNSINYPAEKFIEFWKRAMDYIIELNKKGVLIRERGASIILQKILTDVDANFLEMRSPCGACIGQLSYNHDGAIYSCDEGRMVGEDLFKIGNVDGDDYKKILTSSKTCSLVASSINDCTICDYCAFKPYCGICPVCNFAEQGTIIAKIPETSRCKIYKAQFIYIFNKLKNKEDREILERWIHGQKRG